MWEGLFYFEKLGILKSIMGGSSKIYAGLYNGTPVQIYPVQNNNFKTITKTVTDTALVARTVATILTASDVSQFVIAKLTISGTITITATSDISVWLVIGGTSSSDYALTTFTVAANTTTAKTINHSTYLYSKTFSASSSKRFTYADWGNYKLVNADDVNIGVYRYTTGTSTTSKINSVTATITGLIF